MWSLASGWKKQHRVERGEDSEGRLSQLPYASHTCSPWLSGCTAVDPEGKTPNSQPSLLLGPNLPSLESLDSPRHPARMISSMFK